MQEQKSQKELSTGTTTVGMVFDGGVVLAADKRATMGYMIASKDIDKILPIADHIAMTVAGSVGDAQKLVRWMRAEIRLYELKHGRRISVKAAATLLSNILSNYKFFPFFVQLLIGGYDTEPRLFSVDMVGGLTEEKLTATGSGSPFAYGVLETNYKKEMSEKEAKKVAMEAVLAATKRDAASGEGIDLVIITKDGVKKEPPKKLS